MCVNVCECVWACVCVCCCGCAGECCCGCGCGRWLLLLLWVWVWVCMGMGMCRCMCWCMCMWVWVCVVVVVVCCFLFSEVKFLDVLEDELPRNHLPRMLSLITNEGQGIEDINRRRLNHKPCRLDIFSSTDTACQVPQERCMCWKYAPA